MALLPGGPKKTPPSTAPAVPTPSTTFSTISSSPSGGPSSGGSESSSGSFQGSSGLTPLSFYATPGAGASATAMNRAGVAAAIPVKIPFRGSVVAITLSSTGNISAGSLTLRARKNGSTMTNQTQVAQLVWTSEDTAVARLNSSLFGFVRDDEIDLTFTTTSSYSPTSSVIEGIIWVTQDGSEIV